MCYANNKELKQFVEESENTNSISREWRDMRKQVDEAKAELARIGEEELRIMIYLMAYDFSPSIYEAYGYETIDTERHIETCKTIFKYIKALKVVNTLSKLTDAGFVRNIGDDGQLTKNRQQQMAQQDECPF